MIAGKWPAMHFVARLYVEASGAQFENVGGPSRPRMVNRRAAALARADKFGERPGDAAGETPPPAGIVFEGAREVGPPIHRRPPTISGGNFRWRVFFCASDAGARNGLRPILNGKSAQFSAGHSATMRGEPPLQARQ
jgi:hypothetical protein